MLDLWIVGLIMKIISNRNISNNRTGSLFLPIAVFLFSCSVLSIVQIVVKNPIIILERFFTGGGWIELILISGYGAFLSYKMMNPKSAIRWRRYSWTAFTIVFFLQLGLGLLGFEKFMMTGELHLPIPMMIVGGAVYKYEITFMTLLLLVTLVLSGPAWCSQLCYFGALDNLSSDGKRNSKPLEHKWIYKSTILLLVIIIALLLRFLDLSAFMSTLLTIVFGIIGLVVILIISKRKGKMIHCINFCPIGTIVNFGRYISPFRMYIDLSCTMCLRCIPSCKFDALNIIDLQKKKPGLTCTYCGDCLAACKDNSINYKFLKLKPEHARNLYLFISISLHTIFMALAKI